MNIRLFFLYLFLFSFSPFLAKADSYEKSLERVHKKKMEREEALDKHQAFKQNLHYEGSKNQISLEVALDDFGNFVFPTPKDASAEESTSTLSFFLSYMLYPLPKFEYGRLGIGGRFGVIGRSDFSQSYPFFIALGPKISYAAQFMVGQVIVPVAELGYEKIYNRIEEKGNAGINTKDFNSMVFTLGLLINLNRLDPNTAMKSVSSSGVRKYYLSLLFQKRSGIINNTNPMLIWLVFVLSFNKTKRQCWNW